MFFTALCSGTNSVQAAGITRLIDLDTKCNGNWQEKPRVQDCKVYTDYEKSHGITHVYSTDGSAAQLTSIVYRVWKACVASMHMKTLLESLQILKTHRAFTASAIQ
jgi:hypothetical protein